MAPSNWTDSTDRQLLLIMLHLAAPQLPKWDTVADLMGPDFTAEAVRQHFQKMRKNSMAKFGPPGGSTPGTPTPKVTPRKSKASSQTPTKSAKKRKTMSESLHEEDDEDGSPAKRQTIIKEEHGEDEEETSA